MEHGGFLYDSNSYADDLPYYTTVQRLRLAPVAGGPVLADLNDSKILAPRPVPLEKTYSSQ